MAQYGGNGEHPYERVQKPEHAGAVFGAEYQGLGGLGGSEGTPLEEVHVFWLAGMSCDGCTIAVSGADTPSVEDLLGGTIPGLPRVVLHHPVLSVSAGAEFTKPFHAASEGELGWPYVVVLEGSVPDDQALPEAGGYFSALGAGGFDPASDTEQPNRMTDWLALLCPGAAASVAIGTCATWGGIPAAAGNVTGSMSLMDFLGKEYRSKLGVPVVNVPGCSPVGDNFMEVVLGVLHFLQGTGPLPEFDELGRPAWQFEDTVHRHCPRAGYYEEGVFAEEYGDKQCLVDIGCWGPVVQCNITERGAINHMGGCMVAGGPCIGCTMPGFPDKYTPFYKAPPGSTVSGGISRTYGAAIRRLRRISMRTGNREPLWDNVGEVPSGWSRRHREPAMLSKAFAKMYKKLQTADTPVDYMKRDHDQPVPASYNFLGKGLDEQREYKQPTREELPPRGQGGAHVERR